MKEINLNLLNLLRTDRSFPSEIHLICDIDTEECCKMFDKFHSGGIQKIQVDNVYYINLFVAARDVYGPVREDFVATLTRDENPIGIYQNVKNWGEYEYQVQHHVIIQMSILCVTQETGQLDHLVSIIGREYTFVLTVSILDYLVLRAEMVHYDMTTILDDAQTVYGSYRPFFRQF
jgi:hypothetical protein